MVIHYAASPETVACGRAGSALNSTQDLTEVSCKLCRRTVEKEVAEPIRKTPTLAELRAAAKAAKAAAAAVEAAPTVEPAAAAEPAKPAPAPTPRAALTPRQEWKQRLQQLPGRNRLPRGV